MNIYFAFAIVLLTVFLGASDAFAPTTTTITANIGYGYSSLSSSSRRMAFLPEQRVPVAAVLTGTILAVATVTVTPAHALTASQPPAVVPVVVQTTNQKKNPPKLTTPSTLDVVTTKAKTTTKATSTTTTMTLFFKTKPTSTTTPKATTKATTTTTTTTATPKAALETAKKRFAQAQTEQGAAKSADEKAMAAVTVAEKKVKTAKAAVLAENDKLVDAKAQNKGMAVIDAQASKVGTFLPFDALE